MYKNKPFEQQKTSKTDQQHLIDLPNASSDETKRLEKKSTQKTQNSTSYDHLGKQNSIPLHILKFTKNQKFVQKKSDNFVCLPYFRFILFLFSCLNTNQTACQKGLYQMLYIMSYNDLESGGLIVLPHTFYRCPPLSL